MTALTKDWKELADSLEITLPALFLENLEKDTGGLAWKFLSAAEAISFKAELDLRFDYPGREWRGIPFARSTVSEDVACFDLKTPGNVEAHVIPIRDWHGPRWEFSGDTKTFQEWFVLDHKGHLT